MGIEIERLGSNCNKRWYFGFVYGVMPKNVTQKYHPLYPWWKRWRIRFY